MSNLQKLYQFQSNARLKLPSEIFGYFHSGADQELTLKDNQKAFDSINLNCRISKKISQLDLSCTILGRSSSLPFGFAPTAMHMLAHAKGELITSKIAKQQNICMTISTLSTKTFSDIERENSGGIRYLQLYINKDRKITETLIKLAEKYKFEALVVTVDCQILGKRRIDQKNKFSSPNWIKLQFLEEIQRELRTRDKGQNLERNSFYQNRDLTLNWDFISWIQNFTKLKIILKGILNVQDAMIAASHNVSAIWISNHGGRQLDTVLSSIQALSLISTAFKLKNIKTPLFVDGGIRKGSDIFKCLALGASYVFIGRPLVYGLVQGEQGLTKVVTILKNELQETMRLAGVDNLSSIGIEHVKGKSKL